MLSGAWTFALLLGVGFCGLLRPSELLRLKVSDLLLPSRTLGPPDRMFVLLGTTKTSSRGAHHQHVRIDEPVLISALARLVWGRPDSSALWPHSAHAFR
eukprot:1605264-Alexandrium_andersonii.AAC.1